VNTAAASDTTSEPEKPSMLNRVKKLFEAPKSAVPVPTATGNGAIERLHAILQERDRVSHLVYEENKRAESLSEQLRDKDEERIDALTKARLEGRESDDESCAFVLAEAEVLRRGIEESQAVAKKLRAGLDALDRQIAPLKDAYRQELGIYLDGLYRAAIEQYNARAGDLANAVLRVAAIRRIMIRRMLGNSNGWNGDILLPTMKWQEGNTLLPMLDGGTRGFAERAERRAAEVEEELREFGFKYDWKR
jgi:hypothetical protein